MKKILVVAFIFIFLGIKAQIAPLGGSSVVLTEESISKTLDNSRKNGVKEFEIQIQNDRLHKVMQQQSGLFSANNQKGTYQPPQVNSSSCVNPGFENGTASNWTFASGDNSSAATLPCPSCLNSSTGVVNQVVNATSNATVNNPSANCSVSNPVPCTNGVDNYGSFPVVAPGSGNYSLLLNNTCAGFKMQQSQYTFVVNSSNDVFIFKYAAVLQDGGHPANESPYFDVSTTDLNTGAQPACAQYSAVATSGGLNGWTTSSTSAASSAGGGVSFKPWTTVSLDLQSAVGHTVTIKFTVSDCNQGGHFGYCYIDADCSSPTAASGVVGLCGTTSSNITLTAPPGYNTYQWYGPSPNINTPISGATTQTLSTAAAVGDTFAVKSTSAGGCVSDYKIVVKGSVINAVTSSTATCKGGSNGAVAINTGNGTYQYSWTGPSGALGTSTTTSLNNLLPGTYSVSITDNVAHCPTKDTTITVVAINPTLQTSTAQLCGSQTTLNAPNSFTNTPHAWYDASDALTSVTTQTYAVTGASNGQHYIVTYLDSASHCEDSLKITLAVTNISFNPSPLPSCPAGNTGSITYYPSSGNTFTSFNWVCSNGLSGTNVTAPVQITGLASGPYTTTISIPGNSSCQEIITSTVGVTSNSVIPVSTNTTSVCNLDNVVINPSVPGSSTHSWSGPGISYPTTTSSLIITAPFTHTTTAYYTYVDTVTTTGSGGCSSRSIYKEIVSLKSFKVTTSILERIACYGDSTGKLKATVTSEINGPISTPDKYTFSWKPVTYTSTATGLPSSSILSGLKAGTYYCIIRNGNCVDTTKNIQLLNGFKATGDSIYAYYCPKDSLALLIADTNGNTNIKWHPDRWVLHDTISVSATADSAKVLTQLVPYVYITYKHNGCPDTAKTIISVLTYDAFRPNELVNVFSPNGDKSNDFFYPFYQQGFNQYQIGKQSDTYEMKVYDRWGKLVYETTDYAKPWDGKTKSGHDADNGSYFFVVKYKSNCGSKADLVEKKGFVELVR